MHLDNKDHNLTEMIASFSDGLKEGMPKLDENVYQRLKAIAGKQMSAERSNHTLQPTALVNEAYFKLIEQGVTRYENRQHFFAIAARVMRRLLVDHARAHSAAKRGSGQAHCTLIEDAVSADPNGQGIDILALEAALNDLTEDYPRQAKVVELKFFGGLENQDIAESLTISLATVKRDWLFARAWLQRHFQATP